MVDPLYNVVGVVGAVLIFLGFYRISIGKWTNRSFWYELDNMIGATLLVVYQLHLKAFISVILNTIWMIVAFRGIASFASRYSWNKNKRTNRKR